MKGRIITKKPVLVNDMVQAGLIQMTPNEPPKTKDSRYWRQHSKPKEEKK